MRIDSIRLSWFRGAADEAVLDLKGRSMLVYGANGSGKSSFVDALEYAITDGKIAHLAHEYSGRRQERAILNTHTPHGRRTELSITLCDATQVLLAIDRSGRHERTCTDRDELLDWDCRRTLLRQAEVARFIQDSKGDKYQALLPLLGLQSLEITAENLRQLAKAVRDEGKLSAFQGELQRVATLRKERFDDSTDSQLVSRLTQLLEHYGHAQSRAEDPVNLVARLLSAIKQALESSSLESQRHAALRRVADCNLQADIKDVRSASVDLSAAASPMIMETLEVLKSAGRFATRLEDGEIVACPACGRAIDAGTFQAHVDAERRRLQGLIEMSERRRSAISTLCDHLGALRTSLNSPELAPWRSELTNGAHCAGLSRIQDLDLLQLRTECAEQDLAELERLAIPLVEAAREASKQAPPDAARLADDRKTVELMGEILRGASKDGDVLRIQALLGFLESIEKGVRDELRMRAESVIGEISQDVRSMWAVLHPGEAIEQIRLYCPEDSDKAIDVGLDFHGVAQDSPRLTLSEGHRNSLGLCIFLAMAKREAPQDRPLFLDDVVVSLDRNHRGMIAELLEQQFSKRQVVILTHDREWFSELRHHLGHWCHGILRPFVAPSLGIRWSRSTSVFDDAQALLAERPDSAANDARKIMDTELSIIAERLRIRMPFVRGDKNDTRGAHEFLERLIAEGAKSFQRQGVKDYEPFQEGLDLLDEAKRLLVTWGNRGSHSHSIVESEATKLIERCEAALAVFRCSSCRKHVHHAEARNDKSMQCSCGRIRWRYGKP